MPNWSAKPTGVDNSQVSAGRNGVIFTATNSVTSEVVTQTVFLTQWTAEAAISQCQQMIARLVAQDVLRAQANANLPTITAYIAGLTQPLASG